MSTDRLELRDFGNGILAGLHTRNVDILDERKLGNLHASFLAAFKIVEERYGRHNLRFAIITHKVYGTSGDVDQIFRNWLGVGWATKDAPGTLYRLRISDTSAEKFLSELPGGRDLYLDATTAFLKQYRGY